MIFVVIQQPRLQGSRHLIIFFFSGVLITTDNSACNIAILDVIIACAIIDAVPSSLCFLSSAILAVISAILFAFITHLKYPARY